MFTHVRNFKLETTQVKEKIDAVSRNETLNPFWGSSTSTIIQYVTLHEIPNVFCPQPKLKILGGI